MGGRNLFSAFEVLPTSYRLLLGCKACYATSFCITICSTNLSKIARNEFVELTIKSSQPIYVGDRYRWVERNIER